MKVNIKFWRLERGLSQIELSKAAGVPRYRIQLAEQGLLSLEPEEVEILVDVLGIDEFKKEVVEVSHGK